MVNKIFIFSAIIIALLPFVLADESALYYKNHLPGTCHLMFRNEQTHTENIYNVQVSVRTSGSQILKKFDGNPGLPISYNPFVGSNYCNLLELPDSGYPSMWDLSRLGSVEKVVDTCPQGIIDPTPYDGVADFKCNQLCVPQKMVCVDSSTLKRCRSDGQSVETITCPVRCEADTCIENDNLLYVFTNKESYASGEIIYAKGRFIQPGTTETPIVGVLMTAQLIKSGGVIGESKVFTDSNGEANYTFTGVEATGEVSLKVSASFRGKEYEKSKVVTFVGNPINFKVTTFSYTQYDKEPIKFTVEMKDSAGRYVYPEKLSNLRVSSSLSSGSIISSSVEFKGNGVYEASSVVNGAGRFSGKLEFVYEGTPLSSPIIEIDVEKIALSIDASKIDASASLGETKTFAFNVFDSFGNKIEADSVYIIVEFPDGRTTKQISYSELTKKGSGEYSFDFTFPQIEKYTMNIYAEKNGYVKGSTKATVAVGSEGDTEAGLPIFSYLPIIVPSFIVIFFIGAFVIFKLKKRKK